MTDRPDEPAAALAAYAGDLADAIEKALPGWVERCVRWVADQQGLRVSQDVERQLREAGEAAQRDGAARVRQLLARDADAQAGNPLAVLRSLVSYPTDVLRAAGAAPVARDEFQVRAFPDDAYDLSPASFADVDPALHEPGLTWGAAKAYVHLSRRRGT